MNLIQSSQTAIKRFGALRTKVAHEAAACDVDRIVTLSQAAEKTKARVARRQRQFAAWSTAATLTLMSSAARADMSGTFTALENIMTKFQEFMTGPFGKAAVVISIIAAFVTWVFAPKEGIFGPVLRVVVAGVAIMNAAAWVTNLKA